MFAVRSPTVILLVAMHLAAASVLLSLWLICRPPDLGVRFENGAAAGQVQMTGSAGQAIAELPGDAPVVFRGGGQAVTQPADELRTMFIPGGPPSRLAVWYDGRTRLTQMASSGEMRLETTTVQGRALVLRLQPKPRAIASIGFGVWVLLIGGLVPCLIGAWLWALRPRDWATRWYGVSGIAMLGMMHTAAIWQAKGPAADGAVLWGVTVVNFLCAEIAFWATAALFMRFPKPLLRPRIIYLAAPIALMAAAAIGPAYFDLKLVFLTVLIAFLTGVALGIAQWRAARTDPVARAILGWFGLTVFIGSSVSVALFVAPRLGGGPAVVSNSFGIVPILITYVGVALGVGRYRLFDLDRWSYQVLTIAIAAAVLLALDGALVALLQVQPGPALGVSIALIAVTYAPLRALLWRKLAGKVARVDSALFQQAAEVAFTPDPEARRTAWRALLNQLFQPLHVEPADGDDPIPSIGEHGLALIAPAAAGEGPLVLRYRDGGRRLYNAEHLALVRDLTAFMERAEGARDAYRRGVMEERGRIARDLHDDVGARLLSGLHRPDAEGVRGDVRTALSDMRALVADLVGQEATLERLLADIRVEAADRLDFAGVALDWQSQNEFSDQTVSRAVYRHVRSACREAISNVIKHAGAKRVEVRVEHAAGRLRLTISDDGVGLGPLAKRGRGVGMTSMTQRLQQVGGTVTVEDTAQGAKVEIEAALGG